MLKVLALRLSNNPTAQKSDDGKFNVTSDGRLYLIAEFENPANPFGGVVRRTISQQFDSDNNPIWKVNLASIREKIASGEKIEGNIVTKTVPAYTIGERTVTSFTTVVFAHETVETVFRNHQHPLDETATTAVPQTATEDLPM